MQQKNSKCTWNTLRNLQILNTTNKLNLPVDLNDVDTINEHFSSTVILDKSSVDPYISNKYDHSLDTLSSSFKFDSIHKHEVLKHFQTIKSNASGADKLSLKMLHIIFDLILDQITFIINHCLSLSTFPEVWKESIVIPLPKVSNPESLNDLRPISLLPILSKLFEKIMYSQIIKYLNDNKLIPPTQSGFRQHHSTATALTAITDDFFSEIDKGNLICLINLDYSKAFNCVDPILFCRKLKYFKFSADSIELLKSYLFGRTQRVIYESKYSKRATLECGVPQGSSLGPLLFLLYICDFHEVIDYCSIHQYADDTQLYISFKPTELNDVLQKINSDLNKIVQISSAHNLQLNGKKSTMVLFGPKNKVALVTPHMNININGDIVIPQEVVRNLGIWMDTSLRFTKHINQLCQSSYNVLRQLFPHRAVMPANLKLQICESLILSKLAYCDTVYGPALLSVDSNRLQKIQNSCFRFAFGIRKFHPIRYKIKEMQRLQLKISRDQHLLHLVHKTLTIEQPAYLYNKLIRFRNINNYKTRHSNLLVVPKFRSAIYKRSFSYMASKLYNDLPDQFFDYSLINFKKKLKNLFLSKN